MANCKAEQNASFKTLDQAILDLVVKLLMMSETSDAVKTLEVEISKVHSDRPRDGALIKDAFRQAGQEFEG